MMERKNFDSDFCGSLPLHHINLIQDYGYLIVVDLESFKIIQVSENTVDITGVAVKDLIDRNLADYLLLEDIHNIKNVLNKGLKKKIPLDLHFKNGSLVSPFHSLLHIKNDYMVVELEKVKAEELRTFTTVFRDVKHVIAAIEEANTVQQVCDIAVQELRKISGFDGILMYQFDADWNGTVIAENKDSRLDAYLGQTFPASDVPRQARDLYLKNPYRLIPNRVYNPVRLYPVINPKTGSFIDLSECNLRSVAAVHLEYMANMNIKASMSIRVLYNETLWGLISCHHLEENYLNYEICSVFEWLSTVISSRITLIINKEEFDYSRSLQNQRVLVTDHLYAKDNIHALLDNDAYHLLKLFNATGALLFMNGKTDYAGKVPIGDDFDNLLLWLEGKATEGIFCTHHLKGNYQDASAFSDIASGLLLIPIDYRKGEFVACFRPELTEDIRWGGDPNEAIRFDQDGKNYHPRNSFKMWKQTVFQHSLPWHKQEIEIAASLQNFLFELRIKQLYN